MRERREEAKCRARRHRDIAFAHRAWNSPCNRCEQDGLGFLALAGPEVRRLGDSAPRWPAGLPAQWQRPRMRGCVMWRDQTTEPSRGRLRVVGLKAPRRRLPPRNLPGKFLLRKNCLVSWAVSRTISKTTQRERSAFRLLLQIARCNAAMNAAVLFFAKNVQFNKLTYIPGRDLCLVSAAWLYQEANAAAAASSRWLVGNGGASPEGGPHQNAWGSAACAAR